MCHLVTKIVHITDDYCHLSFHPSYYLISAHIDLFTFIYILKPDWLHLIGKIWTHVICECKT